MNCIVTAGPTYESLDKVRRLTNFSTGQLGTDLADALTRRGHEVILLRGCSASYQSNRELAQVVSFTTTEDLRTQLQALGNHSVHAVFHAAAVSDFAFGKVFRRTAEGDLAEVQAGKLSTRHGPLLAELIPTPKIISELRSWFPQAWLTGWKYEVDGDQAEALRAGTEQLQRCQTDCSVVNGPAYGKGFGCLFSNSRYLHVPDPEALFSLLSAALAGGPKLGHES